MDDVSHLSLQFQLQLPGTCSTMACRYMDSVVCAERNVIQSWCSLGWRNEATDLDKAYDPLRALPRNLCKYRLQSLQNVTSNPLPLE